MKELPSVERETIRSAMRHRILGSASAEAMVVLALVFSICVILFIMTADAAYAQGELGPIVRPSLLNDSARNIIGAWLVAILGFMCVLTARMLWGFDPHRAPMKTPKRR